jgi:uncharacterized protein YegL
MNQDLMDIVMLCDCSGSMGNVKYDMEKSINAFLEDQKEGVGECVVTTFTFNGHGFGGAKHYDKSVPPKRMRLECQYIALSVQKVPMFYLFPSGSTPLHDAICTVIDMTSKRINMMTARERPGKVLFVIITDGLENASTHFNAQDVRDMIKTQEGQCQWQFMYFGANQNAVAVGVDLGFTDDKSVTYAQTSSGISGSASVISQKVSASRSASRKVYTSGESLSITQKDRDECMGFTQKHV